MDYNLIYQKQTLNGWRIVGSDNNLELTLDDLGKVLVFTKIEDVDPEWSRYSNAGLFNGQLVWVPAIMGSTTTTTTTTADPCIGFSISSTGTTDAQSEWVETTTTTTVQGINANTTTYGGLIDRDDVSPTSTTSTTTVQGIDVNTTTYGLPDRDDVGGTSTTSTTTQSDIQILELRLMTQSTMPFQNIDGQHPEIITVYEGDSITIQEPSWSISPDAPMGGGSTPGTGSIGVGGDPNQRIVRFLGWSKEPIGNVIDHQPGQQLTLTEDLTLYAVYEIDDATVL